MVFHMTHHLLKSLIINMGVPFQISPQSQTALFLFIPSQRQYPFNTETGRFQTIAFFFLSPRNNSAPLPPPQGSLKPPHGWCLLPSPCSAPSPSLSLCFLCTPVEMLTVAIHTFHHWAMILKTNDRLFVLLLRNVWTSLSPRGPAGQRFAVFLPWLLNPPPLHGIWFITHTWSALRPPAGPRAFGWRAAASPPPLPPRPASQRWAVPPRHTNGFSVSPSICQMMELHHKVLIGCN